MQKIILLLTILLVFSTNLIVFAKNKSIEVPREQLLSDLNNINLTNETAKDLKLIEEILKTKNPKSIFLEQWIIFEPGNQNLLKNLYKLCKKHNTKLFIVIGRNTWFGKRGLDNSIEAYNAYDKYIDGLVLRIIPDKSNVWKDDLSIQALILNQMLDAYSAIYAEAKKRNKQFIAEFPFWLTDYKGPGKSFSQSVCEYSGRIVFLIDNKKKLDELKIPWNDISCSYNISLAKRATGLNEEEINNTYNKLNSSLTFYSNFNGYLVDSDIQIQPLQKKEEKDNSTTSSKRLTNP